MTYIDKTKNIEKFGGNIYYVSNTYGDDTYNGTDPTQAFASIGKAISEISAGDAITIMAGNYTEEGLDLDTNNTEIWFEIGSQLSPTGGTCLTVSGNFCRVTCPEGALKVNPVSGQTGILVSGNFCYLNEIRVAANNLGQLGFDITGSGADLRRCRCSAPTLAAFKIQGDTAKLEDCCTGGDSGNTSYGFLMTNSCDKTRIKNCGSQGHSAGGYYVVAGCTNGVIEGCYSGGGDGKWRDEDNSFVWSNFSYERYLFNRSILNGSTTYNLFKITGAVKVYNIFGHVTTIIANTSSSINLELYSTNASLDITATGGAPDIQADVVGTVYAKESVTTDPLEKGEPNNTPAVIENTNYRDPKNPIILVEDDAADTYIQLVLSDAVASGAIQWHIEWEPITDDGFVQVV